MYLTDNVHCNELNSSCLTRIHLLRSIFHIIFTVTLFIQAAIPVSTCYEVSSNEHTLNLCSYHTQHSSLALSKINLNATHKSYRRKTQQAILDTIHKASIPATACLYFNISPWYQTLLKVWGGTLNENR